MNGDSKMHDDSVRPVEIFVEPSIAPPGATVEILIDSGDSDRAPLHGFSVEIADAKGELVATLGSASGATWEWVVPDLPSGDLSITLVHDGSCVDTAVLEVGDASQVTALRALDNAIEFERKSIVALQLRQPTEALAAIKRAVELYEDAGAPDLAARATRQLAMEFLRSTDLPDESTRKTVQSLSDLSLECARTSGDDAELVRSLHIISLPDSGRTPRQAVTALCRADAILQEMRAPELLWFGHYAAAATVLALMPRHRRSWQFESETWAKAHVSRQHELEEIAAHGLSFALVTKDWNVRESCLNSLLPTYRTLAVRVPSLLTHEDPWLAGEGGALRWHLKIGQILRESSLPPRWMRAIEATLTPVFSKALLAGVKSFVSYALPRTGPSADLVVKVTREPNLEMFEFLEVKSEPRKSALRSVVSSWLDSKDGTYYTRAMEALSFRMSSGPGNSCPSTRPGADHEIEGSARVAEETLCRFEAPIEDAMRGDLESP